MLQWAHILLATGSSVICSIILIMSIWRCFCKKPRSSEIHIATAESMQDGNAKLHQGSSPTLHRQLESSDNNRRKGNYSVFRRAASTRPLFNWDDHPSLITDAVENGWSRFGFTDYTSSPSTRSSLLGLCAAGDYGREAETEITWEVCLGSADFMQKIRLNSGLKSRKVNNHALISAASVIRTALPLPGPSLGNNSAFPQEAYFEITILCCGGHDQDRDQGERTKLIQENCNLKLNSESLVHVSSSHKTNKVEELKLAAAGDGKGEVMLSFGLTTGGGSLPLKLPGSFPGSIGFNSNGSVFLEGTKLVSESEKADWARTDRVIGCGFDPRTKNVFFTVDAELVHVIHCKSDQFGTPLYPTIAANNDIAVLVNFGQSSFTYAPANNQRTPNPCFIGPLVNSSALGYEDSKELFSMGRIDSQWLNRSTTKGSQLSYGASATINNNNNRAVDFDEESEADLFEIVLDTQIRSPNIVL